MTPWFQLAVAGLVLPLLFARDTKLGIAGGGE